MKVSHFLLTFAYPLCLQTRTTAFQAMRMYPLRNFNCLHRQKQLARVHFPHQCIRYEHNVPPTTLKSYDDQVIESIVLAWVRNWVISQGLCPWAASVMSEKKLNIAVIRHSYENNHLVDVHNSILQAVADIIDPATSTETALVALPAVTDFSTYLEMVADIEELLEHKQLDSEIQLATFHPDYQFEGTKSTDVTNYTNRSPCALLHFLSVPQVTEVIDRVNGNTDFVWKNNIKRLNKLGLEKVKDMQTEITNKALSEHSRLSSSGDKQLN